MRIDISPQRRTNDAHLLIVMLLTCLASALGNYAASGGAMRLSAGNQTGGPQAMGRADRLTEQAALAAGGRRLFLLNCAHCHGQDAAGDEGPDLHGLQLSDARIAARIKNGVKGEMPKFGAKLSDSDVQKIIAYIRSLN